MDRKVAFIWNRFFLFGAPISGVCSLLPSEGDESIQYEGLTLKKMTTCDRPVFFWFSLIDRNENDDTIVPGEATYQAYELTLEELEDLDIERECHEVSTGFHINHTSAFSHIKRTEFSEKTKQFMGKKPKDGLFPKYVDVEVIYNATLELSDEKKLFTFKGDEVVNFYPNK